MIRGDVTPIAHDPPLKRIDLNPPPRRPERVLPEIKHTTENERIWRLVVQAAQGHGA
jgi:hypothetical protein